MEVFRELLRKAKAIDVDKLLQEIIAEPEIEDLIVELNFNKQLFQKGIDIEGDVIGRYSWLTEQMGGREKGKLYNEPYNFKDTGALQRSFDVKSLYKDFDIIANTEKMDDNEKIKDAATLGLTDPNMQILIDAIRPKLTEKINDILL